MADVDEGPVSDALGGEDARAKAQEALEPTTRAALDLLVERSDALGLKAVANHYRERRHDIDAYSVRNPHRQELLDSASLGERMIVGETADRLIDWAKADRSPNMQEDLVQFEANSSRSSADVSATRAAVMELLGVDISQPPLSQTEVAYTSIDGEQVSGTQVVYLADLPTAQRPTYVVMRSGMERGLGREIAVEISLHEEDPNTPGQPYYMDPRVASPAS